MFPTLVYPQSRFTDAVCQLLLLYTFQIMKDSYGLTPFFFQKKAVANELDVLILVSPSFFLCVTLMLWSFDKIFCFMLHKFQFLGFFASVIASLYLYIDKKGICEVFVLRVRLIRTPGQYRHYKMPPPLVSV